MEEASLNISVTGSQEAVASIRAYLDELARAGEVQTGTAASTDKLTAAIGGLTKALGGLNKEAASAAKGETALADSNKVAASAVDKAMASIEAQSGVLKANADASKAAAAGRMDMAAAEEKGIAPTQAQTMALENQTRQLILQRDATLASMKSHQKFTENFAASAPKLTRGALYLTAGVAGAAYEGIKQYMDFNTKMTQTFTQAGVAFSKQKALTQNMANIAKETGRNFNDVANSLYRIGSATAGMNKGFGATTSQLTSLVRQTENLQVLGNLTTGAQSEQAARIMGAVVNSGVAGSNTKQIAAQVNAIVGSGDIRMSELITALGRGVLTSGKSVGLNLKQVGAYIDLLTSRGTTGASAGTYVAHAFQLLAGSTSQAANWQAAMGLNSGEMTNTMKHKGLNAAVQLLYSHMQKLQATPYLTVGKLTGQAAAEKMMQKAGLSPDEIAAWEKGLAPGSDMQTAVMQRAMTAMFGGGRQAMPLMTLMQSAGLDMTNVSKAMGGQGKGPSYQEILDAINRHSTAAYYAKDVNKAMNTPQVQERKLLRTLQWDLIQFGKAVTPIWLDMLHAGIKAAEFLGKFKGFLYEIAAALGAVLAVVAAKQVAKFAGYMKDFVGGASYWSQRALGRAGSEGHLLSKKSWAGKYANKRGLIGGTAYAEKELQVQAANELIDAGLGLLKAAGSLETAATMISEANGFGKGKLGGANWGMSQTISKKMPWARGVENILPMGTHAVDEAGNIVASGGAGMLGTAELANIRRNARRRALGNLKNTYGPGNSFTGMSREQRLARLEAQYQHEGIHGRAPVKLTEEELHALSQHAGLTAWRKTGGRDSLGRMTSPQPFIDAAKKQFVKTGLMDGMNIPMRSVESEAARAASSVGGVAGKAATAIGGVVASGEGSAALGAAEKGATGLLGILGRFGGVASGGLMGAMGGGGVAEIAGGALGMAGGPLGIAAMVAMPLLMPLLAPYMGKITNSIGRTLGSVGSSVMNIFGGGGSSGGNIGTTVNPDGTLTAAADPRSGAQNRHHPRGLGVGFLMNRQAILRRQAAAALKQGRYKRYLDLKQQADLAGEEAWGMATHPQGTERMLAKQNLHQLQSALHGYKPYDHLGNASDAYFTNSHGKHVSRMVIGGVTYEATDPLIQQKLHTAMTDVRRRNHLIDPANISHLSWAQAATMRGALQADAIKGHYEGFGRARRWVGGQAGFHLDEQQAHQLGLKNAGNYGKVYVGGKWYSASQIGHSLGYSHQLDKVLGIQDPHAKVDFLHDPRYRQLFHGGPGGGLMGAYHSRIGMKKFDKGFTQHSNKAIGDIVRLSINANKAHDEAQYARIIAKADKEHGDKGGAKESLNAAKRLEETSTKLHNAAAEIKNNMKISNMDEFGSQMQRALQDSGIGKDIAAAITLGIGTHVKRK